MSNKKALDILGETHLPADLLTPTEGLNGLLDTYPDLDYGAGVLNQFLPEGEGHESGLPDGVVRAEDEGLGHLGEFLKEGNLADLEWLEVAEQDVDRLPQNPVDLGIPQLEEAWGVERRTDGTRIPALDLDEVRAKEAAADTSIRLTPNREQRKALREVVRKAMRRSDAGVSWEKIRKEALASAGDFAFVIQEAMRQVKADHGLAGKVFIRAEAYPGYEQGRWNDHLKKAAAGARYIVVPKGQKNAAHHYNGICTVTGKKVVTSIPWKAAYSHYAPLLRATGRRVASNPDDPRKALLRAFRAEAKGPGRIESDRPTHIAPSERVSSTEAREEFAKAPTPERKVYNRQAAEAARARKDAAHRVMAWVRLGLLAKEDAVSIAKGASSGHEMLRQAASRVMRVKGASAFSGLANDVRPPDVTIREAKAELDKVEAPAPISTAHRPIEAKKKQAHVRIAKMVRAGLLDKADGARLVQSEASPRAIMQTASALVHERAAQTGDYSGIANAGLPEVPQNVTRKAALAYLGNAEKEARKRQAIVDGEVKLREFNASRKGRALQDLSERCFRIASQVERGLRGEALAREIRRNITAEESQAASMMLGTMVREQGLDLRAALEPRRKAAKTYEGHEYRVAQAETRDIAARPQEVRGLLKWALQKMNEGMAGDDLTALLSARFSGTARTAAEGDLRALRAEHEGLAGHLYVDASAYASATGMKGCEKGGTQHRANAIPTVMEMPRCGSCTRRVAKADGSFVCQVYNKPLVTASDLPVEDIRAYQKQSIKAANASDAELTASLFAPSHDPSEFNLHNAAADDIGFEDAPDAEEIGEVVFGGMEW